MAKFCSDDCNAVCDFCKHYQDEYRDILQLKREDGSYKFSGEGICEVDGKETDASGGYHCEDFVCFRVEELS